MLYLRLCLFLHKCVLLYQSRLVINIMFTIKAHYVNIGRYLISPLLRSVKTIFTKDGNYQSY